MLDGNTLHMSASRWFQSVITYLKWLMWDLRSDFPSYRVNFGGLNFSKGSIPSISGTKGFGTSKVILLRQTWSIPSTSRENGIWYLRTGSFGPGLDVRATDPNADFTRCHHYSVVELITQNAFSVSLGIEGLVEIHTSGSNAGHLMVMSRLSPLSGSNRPGYFLEVALTILWALTSRLASLSPRVLGAGGGSP
ncbi:hypothetical protein Acr_10g0009950 [Actinidia rufa]|uniref:Uncharacterized protein n=1 Tax=Actinidia rufa TaxID=165716 RepID=A0A7J0FA84_9ERIC|nr:hypothetical protein Acr_10g0009950 [Actinidia rufa]